MYATRLIREESSYNELSKDLSRTYPKTSGNGISELKWINTIGQDYFRFKERRGHFDWRLLSSVDVDKVLKEVINK